MLNSLSLLGSATLACLLSAALLNLRLFITALFIAPLLNARPAIRHRKLVYSSGASRSPHGGHSALLRLCQTINAVIGEFAHYITLRCPITKEHFSTGFYTGE